MPAGTEDATYISVRILIEDYERVKEIARNDSRTISNWVRIAITEKLERDGKAKEVRSA